MDKSPKPFLNLSAEHIRNTNICLVFNKSISGEIHQTFANNCDRSLIFITHFVTKCSSSSTILHFLHIIRSDGTIGLEYLPRSISKISELARSFVMAVRYLWSLALNKYDSGPKLDLNRRYVLKSGLSLPFHELLTPMIQNPGGATFLTQNILTSPRYAQAM